MNRTSLAFTLAVLAVSPSNPVRAQGQTWGDVKGRIVWGGKDIPAPAKIKLPADNASTPMCLKANKGDEPPDENWVVHQKNRGLRDVFVWLSHFDDPRSTKPLPTHPKLKEIKIKEVVIDQPACHFIAHAIALREGQSLVVKNSAPFPHNFKWGGTPAVNPGGNFIVAPGGSEAIAPVADNLAIQVECGIHPWMKGWMRVYSHPYYAVTDENGAFEFKDAPAGNFRIMIWHANGWRGGAKGSRGDPIEIGAGKVLDLGNLEFPPPPAN